MSFSIRTIFLFIRGIDQTGRAMTAVEKRVETLKEKQEQLAQVSYRMLFAGAAFTAFGAMIGKTLADIIGETDRGSGLMDDFSNAITRLKENIGDVIMDKFGEQLEGWLTSLTELTADQWKMEVIGTLLFEGTQALVLGGLTLLGTGALATALSGIGSLVGGSVGAFLLSLAGFVSGAGIAIAAGIVVTFTLKFVWNLLDEEQQEFIEKFITPLDELPWADPAESGLWNWLKQIPDVLDYYGDTSIPGALDGYGFNTGLDGMNQLQSTNNTINVTIGQVNTQMDEEELMEGYWAADAYYSQNRP